MSFLIENLEEALKAERPGGLKPKNQSERDHVIACLYAFKDFGVTGDWDEMVEFAVRSCRRGDVTHKTFSAWLRAHPQKATRAYTEVQHEEGER
jgi:hypothetical protein